MGSRGRLQARSPTVQRRGKRGEEGAWGWRRRTLAVAVALCLPPGCRGCHTSPVAISLEQHCGWVLARLEGLWVPSEPGRNSDCNLGEGQEVFVLTLRFVKRHLSLL